MPAWTQVTALEGLCTGPSDILSVLEGCKSDSTFPQASSHFKAAFLLKALL